MDELTELGGAWKGLVVSQDTRLLIHLWLEFHGKNFRGRFEISELDGSDSRGEIEGSMNGREVTASTSSKFLFDGHLLKTNSAPMMLGLLRNAGSNLPFASATLFHAAGDFGTTIIAGYHGDELT